MTTRSDACVAHASSWDSGRRQLHIGVPGRDLFSRVVSHRAGQGTGGTVCTVPNSRTSTRILSLYHQPWIKNAAFPLSPPIIPVKVVLFASVAKRQVENAAGLLSRALTPRCRYSHSTPATHPHPQVTPARGPYHPVSRNSCQGRRSMAQVRREGECLHAVCRTGAVYAAVPAVLRAAHRPPWRRPGQSLGTGMHNYDMCTPSGRGGGATRGCGGCCGDRSPLPPFPAQWGMSLRVLTLASLVPHLQPPTL